MPSKLLPKHVWKDAVGAKKKSRRLSIQKSTDGLFHCPVSSCDNLPYKSQRGCRKHVYQRHGWFYYFDERPDIDEVLPKQIVETSKITKAKKSQTSDMPSFLKTCTIYKSFRDWLMSPGGSSKGRVQAEQISSRVLKYFRFCCQDVCPTWDIPFPIVDYCVGSITQISDFVDHLSKKWNVGYSGIIGYMNALSHLLDYRRITDERYGNNQTFMASEIYIQRVKQSLAKKMRSEWNVLLSVEYLSSINCWATLNDLQDVIPFHGDKFAQILVNSSTESAIVSPHDLSFCTSFVTTILFLMVKASRPMTYQVLTAEMFRNIDYNGFIDQTIFKTKDKYGFDSLIFSNDVVDMINGYIKCIRPRLTPRCNFLLVTKHGSQLTRLGDVFGRMVFQAIGKYVHPTRYRQIVETESAEKLTIEEQYSLSEDQKHTSNVAKVHYKKLRSHTVAERGKQAMVKLRSEELSTSKVKEINNLITGQDKECDKIDFSVNENALINDNKSNQRRAKVLFSKEEDGFILAGIKKYGKGKWKSILSDPDYKFNSSRTTATLLTRAKSCKFI